jgi:hypothetical protein
MKNQIKNAQDLSEIGFIVMSNVKKEIFPILAGTALG